MPVPADSYSSIADADAYFAKRMFTSAWTNLSDDDIKQAALNHATQIIDAFNYLGWPAVSGQAHAFPRSGLILNGECMGDSVTPDQILFAQYEIALALVKGIDPEREMRRINVTSRGFGSVRTTYDTRAIPPHLLWGVPSALGWLYLSAFLDWEDARGIKLHRVS